MVTLLIARLQKKFVHIQRGVQHRSETVFACFLRAFYKFFLYVCTKKCFSQSNWENYLKRRSRTIILTISINFRLNTNPSGKQRLNVNLQNEYAYGGCRVIGEISIADTQHFPVPITLIPVNFINRRISLIAAGQLLYRCISPTFRPTNSCTVSLIITHRFWILLYEPLRRTAINHYQFNQLF